MKISMTLAAAALTVFMCSGEALAAQPHMHNALTALMRARAELVAARPDKGGHRVAAIRAVDAAIRQTKAGIAYAND
ncbi:MAG: hypothetical protein JO208_12510 [Alphaproteobacteria bacterium]|nr:hypothetical protein [Alphaproteobacteria bacterium]